MAADHDLAVAVLAVILRDEIRLNVVKAEGFFQKQKSTYLTHSRVNVLKGSEELFAPDATAMAAIANSCFPGKEGKKR